MPEENTEQLIERIIKVYLEAEGCDDVSRGVKDVKKEIDKLRTAAKVTGKEMKDLNLAMLAGAKKYVAGAKKVTKVQTDEQKRIGKTTKDYNKLGKTVTGLSGKMNQLAGSISKIAMGGGFQNAINQAVQYERSILLLSSTVNTLGRSFTDVEKHVSKMSKTLSLSRSETIKAMQDFEMNFRYPDPKLFEASMKRIQGMVGASPELMKKYQGALDSLANKFSGLAMQIASINDETPKSVIEGIKQRVSALQRIGDIDREHAINLRAIIAGNKQKGFQDKEAVDKAKAHTVAVEKIKKTVEDLAISFGQTLLPLVTKFANWLDRITEGGEKWGKVMGYAIAAFAGLKVANFLMISTAMKGMIPGLTATPGLLGAVGGATKMVGTAALVAGAAFLGWKIGGEIFKGLEKLGEEVKWIGDAYAWTGNKAARFYNWVSGSNNEGSKKTNDRMDVIKKSQRYKDKQLAMGIKDEKEREKALAGWRKKYGAQRKKQPPPVAAQPKQGSPLQDPAKGGASAVDPTSEYKKPPEEITKELGDMVKKITEVREAQFSTMGAAIERMKISGQVDGAQLQKMSADYTATLDAEVEAAKRHNNAIKGIKTAYEAGELAGGTSIEDAAEMLGLSEDVVSVLKDQNWENVDALNKTAKIKTNERIMLEYSQKKLEFAEKQATVYDTHIEQSGLLAEEAGLLVQLADSYAIGVGASAQMRMREFEAIDKNITNLSAKQDHYKKKLAEGNNSLELEISLENKIQELQNRKTQEMVKQAGLTKSLRDGWIEAIGSMNTGAGTFSKIIMDQNKGTAQSLKLAGQSAVTSSVSGSLRGGYGTSERFSTMQGQGGQGLLSGSSGKRNLGYKTSQDRELGTATEGIQWKYRNKFTSDMAKRNQAAMKGKLGATAFGASKHYEGVVGEGGGGEMPDAPQITAPPKNRAEFLEQKKARIAAGRAARLASRTRPVKSKLGSQTISPTIPKAAQKAKNTKEMIEKAEAEIVDTPKKKQSITEKITEAGGDPKLKGATEITDKGKSDINVNVKLQGNASQVSKEIAQKIGAEVSRIVHSAAAKSLDGVKV